MKKLVFFLLLTKLFNFLPLMELVHKKIQNRIRLFYKKKIEVGNVKIKSINTILIENFSLRSNTGTLILKFNQVSITLCLKNLLQGKSKLNYIDIQDLNFYLYSSSPHSDQNAIHNDNKIHDVDNNKLPILARKIYDLIFQKSVKILSCIDSVNCTNLNIFSSNENSINIPSFKFNDGLYNVIIKTGLKGNYQENSIHGFIKKSDLMHSFSIVSEQIKIDLAKVVGKDIYYEAELIEVYLNKGVSGNQDFPLELSINIKNLQIRNASFSDDHLVNQNISSNIYFNYNEKGLFIDETSKVLFNQLPFSIFFEHEFDEGDTISTAFILEECSAKEIMAAFPNFSTRELYSSNISGSISVLIWLKFQLADPVNHAFNVKVSHNISLNMLDSLNFNYLKQPFTHTVRDNGKVVRNIFLGDDNPHFTPLEKNAEILQKVIVLTEDSNFFSHGGFDQPMLGYALVSNIAKRKYSRGGSTITMQLSRNLFLNHKKNIYRKFEEILLTWLLEKVFVISKQRLLEIYLNIIEFGPDIYGISEATNFYFSKRPKDVTLTESIVLSYIIPRPKFFLEALMIKSPILRKNLKNHIEIHSKRMLRNEEISVEEFNKIPSNIQFSNDLGILVLE